MSRKKAPATPQPAEAPAAKHQPAPATLKSERLEAALGKALDGAPAEFLDQLVRGSGMPGPRPNLDLARAVGAALVGAGARGLSLIGVLEQQKEEYFLIVAAQAHAARIGAGKKDAADALQRLAEDERHIVRLGVIDALRALIDARGEAAVRELAAWTDGYLQAHVAVAALAERATLARLPTSAGPEVLARLDEAFALADKSPRAAERLQGVRQLRQALPAQIATIAARYPEALEWLTAQAAAERPETREVVAQAITALRKEQFSAADADRIAAALTASAPPARDAARIVHGTRKRSKGRR